MNQSSIMSNCILLVLAVYSLPIILCYSPFRPPLSYLFQLSHQRPHSNSNRRTSSNVRFMSTPTVPSITHELESVMSDNIHIYLNTLCKKTPKIRWHHLPVHVQQGLEGHVMAALDAINEESIHVYDSILKAKGVEHSPPTFTTFTTSTSTSTSTPLPQPQPQPAILSPRALVDLIWVIGKLNYSSSYLAGSGTTTPTTTPTTTGTTTTTTTPTTTGTTTDTSICTSSPLANSLHMKIMSKVLLFNSSTSTSTYTSTTSTSTYTSYPIPHRLSSKLIYAFAILLPQSPFTFISISYTQFLNKMISLIEKQLADGCMNELEIVNIVYSIAKLGFKFNHHSNSLQGGNDSHNNLNNVNNHVTAFMTPQLFNLLCIELIRIARYMGDIGLCNTLWAFGSMDIQWKSLPINLQIALKEQILITIKSSFSLHSYSNLLIGMAKMGIDKHCFEPKLWTLIGKNTILLNKIGKISKNLTISVSHEQSLSSIIGGLGSVGYTYISLDTQSRLAINAAINYLPQLSMIGIVTVIHGLSKMEWGYRYIDSNAKLKIFTSIDKWVEEWERVLLSPTSTSTRAAFNQQLAKLLKGLAGLKTILPSSYTSTSTGTSTSTSHTLPLSTTINLLLLIQKSIFFQTEQGVMTMISSLNTMQLNLSFISLLSPSLLSLQNDLLLSIGINIDKMSGQAVSNILWSMQGLRMGGGSETTNIRYHSIQIYGELIDAATQLAIGNGTSTSTSTSTTTSTSTSTTTSTSTSTTTTTGLSPLPPATISLLFYSLGSICELIFISIPLPPTPLSPIPISTTYLYPKISKLLSLLISCSTQCSYLMTAREIAIIIYSLGKLSHYGFFSTTTGTSTGTGTGTDNGNSTSTPTLPYKIHAALTKQIIKIALTLTHQDFANIIWGFAQFNIIFIRYSLNLKIALLNTIKNKKFKFEKKSLSAVLAGLGKGGGSVSGMGRGRGSGKGIGSQEWRELPSELKEKLVLSLDHVVEGLGYTTPTGQPNPSLLKTLTYLGNLVYSLGRLGVHYDDEDINKTSFFPCVIHAISTLQQTFPIPIPLPVPIPALEQLGRSFSFIVNGLARMKFWEFSTVHTHSLNFSTTTTNSSSARLILLLSLAGTIGSMNKEQLANVLWSLGIMKVDLSGTDTGMGMDNGIASTTISTQYSSIPIPTPIPILEYQQIITSLRDNIFSLLEFYLPKMSVFELAWSLWFLARCEISYVLLPKKLTEIIISTSCAIITVDIDHRILGVALWSIGRLKFPINVLPPYLIDVLFAGIENLLVNGRDNGTGRGRGSGTTNLDQT